MKFWRKELIFPVTMVAIVLGFLISLQMQTHKKSVTEANKINQERTANMKTVMANTQEENERLKKEHQDLIVSMDTLQERGSDPLDIELLNNLMIMDGTRAVQGLGIQIVVDDRIQEHKTVFPLTANELLEMINVLRFAGAEAISINGQRIVGATAIVNSGTAILVNQVPIRRAEGIPYEFNVIGDQETLVDYFTNLEAVTLKEKGGMAVSISKKTVQIPSYKGSYTFKYAKPPASLE
ncbi:MAG: DUF881 domain-containing protein [Peptococcaceae bacterium]|jgi:uncharacterized protein YlxW (UPF0749 family)|nr:DUF881 domain-containing protein [Peptococcaceae bacterium]